MYRVLNQVSKDTYLVLGVALSLLRTGNKLSMIFDIGDSFCFSR